MFLSRPKFLAPAVALALSACVSKVVYLPAPTDQPAPAPAPVVEQPVESYYEPLEVTVGRPVRERFVVQTNRPAYVAIFEVIPGEGITIVRPGSARESYVVAGLSSVRVPWSATVFSRTSASTGPRYLYAVASDEPLAISDQTFQPGFLRYTLGTRVYRSSDPYEAMRALSRHFVVRGIAEEEWAEDVVVVRPDVAAPRVAYVYCPGGVRFEVPIDMAERVRCARPDRVARNDPPRAGNGNGRDGSATPDSVIGDDRRRVRPKVPTQVGRGPIDRVREPVVAGNNGRGPVTKGGVPASEDNGRGRDGNGASNGNGNGSANGAGNGNGVSNGRGDDDRGNNGNAYGHQNGNNGSNGNNGNNGNAQSPSRPVVIPATASDSLRGDAPAAKPAARPQRVPRPSIGGQVRPQLPAQAERAPARPVREEPAPRVEPEQPRREEPQRVEPPRAESPRAEPKREDPRPEPREEARPEPKAESRPEPRDEPRPADEAKPKEEQKPEPKPDKPEAKPEKPAAKPAKPASAADSTAARLKEKVRGRPRP